MLERGLERALGTVTYAAYVEIEAFCIWNLVAKMEQGMVAPAPIWSDLKTFPARKFYGKIHGIIGGYPCQPFSVAGNQKGESDPRHLWPFIRSHINAIKPVWCFFENVANHINIGFDTVKSELEEMGYSVEVGIYSADEVGAPHQRKRLFIFAISNTNRKRLQAFIQEWFRCLYQSNESFKRSEYSRVHPADELADTASFNGRLSEPKERIKNNETSGGSENMANTHNTDARNYTQGFFTEAERSCVLGKWPARPGEPQHEWEEKRTVKPGLGCTVNGYNFREDLLRMLGNGVVEQTAEIAFIDLLRKHLFTSQIH